MKFPKIFTFLSICWRLNSAKRSSDKIATEINSISRKRGAREEEENFKE